MKITKRQLRKIIKEEKQKLLREYDEADAAPVTNGNDHHWPRVEWSNVYELVDAWKKMEEGSFDPKDPSMSRHDEISATEAKQNWKDQVEGAAMDLEAELTIRIRKAALEGMQEFTDKLMNGEYA
jgi:hypothetical protein